ncbi:hypothetical protein BU23DRAFT_575147 [Bimuria novae-zelandiae CBS 107.79]|uniref:Uncharacterized protein n=1 Tax=Bimuria novae-zelandiae CBS 107.79 TaxID=1447943 RepID=A0A6A5UK87_9PLEO|nr:hypothetical protein BU23DRAFT_575147 [Bimuria novae-zelandiae CBS 107.79]
MRTPYTPLEDVTETYTQGRNTTTAYPLHYTTMPGKEPHWQVNHYGKISIPSPIPVLPKPLALSYRNYYNNYGQIDFVKQEKKVKPQKKTKYCPRALAGGLVISALLRHYFPRPENEVKEIFPGTGSDEEFKSEPVLAGMSLVGTRHWIVQQQEGSQEIVAVVVLVTDPKFFQLGGRETPTTLGVTKDLIDAEGRVVINKDNTMPCGAVVLVAGTWDPVKPQFEFYEISMAPEYAPLVDQMFKAVRWGAQRVHGGDLSMPKHTMETDKMAPSDLLIKRKTYTMTPPDFSIKHTYVLIAKYPKLGAKVTAFIASPTPAPPVSPITPPTSPVKRKATSALESEHAPMAKQAKLGAKVTVFKIAAVVALPMPAPPAPASMPKERVRHRGSVTPEFTGVDEAYVKTVKQNGRGLLIEGATGR